MASDIKRKLASYYDTLRQQKGEEVKGRGETYGFWMGVADELLTWLRTSANVKVEKQDERSVRTILRELA